MVGCEGTSTDKQGRVNAILILGDENVSKDEEKGDLQSA